MVAAGESKLVATELIQSCFFLERVIHVIWLRQKTSAVVARSDLNVWIMPCAIAKNLAFGAASANGSAIDCASGIRIAVTRVDQPIGIYSNMQLEVWPTISRRSRLGPPYFILLVGKIILM